MYIKLKIKYGNDEFIAHVDPRDDIKDEKINSAESLSFNVLKTVGDLRQLIAKKTNTDASKVKIIHRGKFIGNNCAEPLKNYDFKDLDRLMIMGATKQVSEDFGFKVLGDYEKKHLVALNENLEDNKKEIIQLERNFLEGQMVKDMIKRMDKQLQTFTQVSMSHLESIDALQIFNEKTSEAQKMRNREKRKSIIQGIQDLLNRNDKLLFQLNQYSFKIEHPDEGH